MSYIISINNLNLLSPSLDEKFFRGSLISRPVEREDVRRVMSTMGAYMSRGMLRAIDNDRPLGLVQEVGLPVEPFQGYYKSSVNVPHKIYSKSESNLSKKVLEVYADLDTNVQGVNNLQTIEKTTIIRNLRETEGNITLTAANLGITVKTLYNKLNSMVEG